MILVFRDSLISFIQDEADGPGGADVPGPGVLPRVLPTGPVVGVSDK